MKSISKWIGKQIWMFTEFWNIPLGKLAPYIFGMAMGSMPRKLTKEESERLNKNERNKI